MLQRLPPLSAIPLFMALLGLTGCSIQRTIPVAAQYPGLKGPKVAVLAMAPPDSHDPSAGPAVSNWVSRQLQIKFPQVQLLPPAKTKAYVNANPYWVLRPMSEVAKALQVDEIVVIDISQLLISEPNSELLKGDVSARVDFYQAASADPDAKVFSTVISAHWPITGYPEGKPNGFQGLTWQRARDQTLEWFSFRAAGVFFDHEEPK